VEGEKARRKRTKIKKDGVSGVCLHSFLDQHQLYDDFVQQGGAGSDEISISDVFNYMAYGICNSHDSNIV
jgi:hypothetical protein